MEYRRLAVMRCVVLAAGLAVLAFAQQGSAVDWSPWDPYLPIGGAGACPECCFDDVTVSNAAWFTDGTYEYTGLVASSRPTFSFGEWIACQGPNMEDWLYREGEIYYDSAGNEWMLFSTYSYWYFQGDTVPGSPPGGVTYTNTSDAPTPPATGWTVSSSTNAGPTGTPLLSGGESCLEIVPEIRDIIIVPTGAAADDAFLDRGVNLLEGEDPPTAGSLPISAIYAVGESVTGSCQILHARAERPLLSYVHVFAYRLDLGTRPEGLELIEHWMARHDWVTRRYLIEWDTGELKPGFYELYLSFEDKTSERLRIEVVSPPVD